MDLKAEMAGTVMALTCGPGDAVGAGDELLVLESMKMEVPLLAPMAGTVQAIHVEEGEVVQEGQILLSLG
ncbi:biotin/lipoyl-binding carrier protein [Enterovirga sp. CN4-39]|uniref:biotin/lipoyl-binding carrier protein n=1 Tax=Enterovirga sp. CN4-39 TaxID=3400910 RepID=UPI003C0094B1